ncbi:MAG: L-carnitine dehydratase/bile acid-inducible protein [Actinomycetia bacterium]|nr:L-carnitine dehydratase/bile acid-inducible protein [Actinomycetes bacterium]
MTGAPFTGVRVLDRTTEIAGPYCTKLLADAGADVVKVERQPDPLRAWGSGALFEFLNASKRSVDDDADLVPGADLVVTDRPQDVSLIEQWPGLVVVTVTPFGCDGPWAGRPATEFTLQAACGSIGIRGLPEQPPLSAGGRFGEWMTGTYAAVAAAAALRSARAGGGGEHVDIAMFDCMAVSMTTYPTVFADFHDWPPVEGTGRSLEVPSIEPTADGYAVMTTNSAQQFQDLLVVIGRADLIEDTDLANVYRRFARRDEFLAAVHAHTTTRTTAELLAELSDFRVPSGPVLDGGSVPGFEQFVARDVFVPSPSGRFRQPRVPYRISGVEARPFTAAPEPGADTVAWPPGPSRGEAPWHLPLRGIRVVDCTAWWAGPSAAHVLACLGADVVKVESVARPDMMRYTTAKAVTDDQWWEWGPVFHGVNVGKRGVTLDLASDEGIGLLRRLIDGADVLVENFTPRVMDQFGLEWGQLHESNPRLVMVRMPAFGLDGPWRDRTAFAQTMEALTGMAWMTGFAEGPPVLLRGACDPLAGMHAVFATLAALEQRDRAGTGNLVEAVMVEAALNAAAEQVVEHDASGTLLRRSGNRGPCAAPQGLYACAGVERWVAVAVATDAQWIALTAVVGRPDWAADAALATADGRRAAHDELDAGLAMWCAGQDATAVASVLSVAGVPAERVIAAPELIGNPQLRHRRLFESVDHPVVGVREVPTMPFRFGRVARWVHRAAPTLGQHNDEVLGEVAGPDELARLRAAGVIGDRLAVRSP